jgi:hypothetical protein
MPEPTIATERHLFPVREGETAKLIEMSTGQSPLALAFGTGGAALIWEAGQPMPWYVEQLGLMRGVLNENMDGAGI